MGDAGAIGRWLGDHSLVPDRAVVSPARRARQTWDLAAAQLDAAQSGAVPERLVDERVYDNTVESLLAVIGDGDPAVVTLALVGHSPSVQELALALDDGRGNTAALAELAQKYPTSGIAVFDVDREWATVDVAGGTLRHFAVPRAAPA